MGQSKPFLGGGAFPGIRRPRPEHGLAVVPPVDEEERTPLAGVGVHGGRGQYGTRDGLVDVTCYCGRSVVRMTPEDVWNGVAPPACRTIECRNEEDAR